MPRVSPRLEPPEHLRPIVEAIESTLVRERRVVISTPPQHGKTFLISHAIVWVLARQSHKRNAYVTYGISRAKSVSLEIQRIAQDAGLNVDGARDEWRIPGGGTLVATGIGGRITGYGFDGLFVVDDPVKDRVAAESALLRERTDEWFRGTAMSRVHPGASVIVVQTRWHPDDLAGRLIARGWEWINLPAINDGTDARRAVGEPLWPRHRPKAWLERQQAEIGPYEWASLYQGQPRPRGGRVFNDAHLYDPKREKLTAFRVAFGLDLAYSQKTSADYSVCVILAKQGERYYVLDVIRGQMSQPEFAAKVKTARGRFKGAPVTGYVHGTELGAAQFFQKLGIPFDARPTHGDKFVRAQPVSVAWNAGKILVPGAQLEDANGDPDGVDSPEWVDPFLKELQSFTGIRDRHDDQVDALAAAFDRLQGIDMKSAAQADSLEAEAAAGGAPSPANDYAGGATNYAY